MIWLLDTNACIHLLNRRSAELAQNFSRRSSRQIRLCSVVKFELRYTEESTAIGQPEEIGAIFRTTEKLAA